MSLLLATMFGGITLLCHAFGLVPRANETILSQLAHLAFGTGAVGFRHLEERGVVGLGDGGTQEEHGVGAGGDVLFEVEAEGAAGGSLAETGD